MFNNIEHINHALNIHHSRTLRSFSANTPEAIGWSGSESNMMTLTVRQQTIGELSVSNQTPLAITIIVALVMIVPLTFRLRRKRQQHGSVAG